MPTNAIQEAIRRVRNQGAMIRLRTETGYLEIDASQESDVVTEFTLTIRQQGELHRSRSIDGLTVWKLLSDHDFRVLSTSAEIHALVLGLAVGTHAGATGDVRLIADLIGVGAAGSRLQKRLPDKFREQITAELPYFIAGVAIGYAGTRYGSLLVDVGGV